MATITSSAQFRGLLTTWLPIAELPPGRGWFLYSGNATHNTWLKLPPKPSLTARRTLARLKAA